MLKLKNVSKFYYNKGVIASGFNKVSIQFDIGEFVVITGESGSGKSTLLNVISGLDSYEEGEMYINDLEILMVKKLAIMERVILKNIERNMYLIYFKTLI